jgi:DNA replication and repair protein RecF
MHLKHLTLFNFRNYQETKINFFKGINVIYGENGAGKTNILEAIYFLALTKSFRTSSERHLVLNKQNMFRIKGEFENAQGRAFECSIAYALTEGKRLVVNSQRFLKFSDYIGEVPTVLLEPSDLTLSQGSPQQRRRFLDLLLCQSHKLYLHHLIQYNRSLKQRNRMLQAEKNDVQLLYPWEENLIKNGVEIIKKRKETVQYLSETVKNFYQSLGNKDDKIKIIYQSNIEEKAHQPYESVYREQFNLKRAEEIQTGYTKVGPHRDELLFLLKGKPMKIFASQGEHKTFIIALKLAEFYYLQRNRSETPLLLFDDIFGELDATRIQLMLDQLSDFGQVFVTTTSRNFFNKAEKLAGPLKYFKVQKGEVLVEAN